MSGKTALELTAHAQAACQEVQETARATSSSGFVRRLQEWNEKIASERIEEARALAQVRGKQCT
jgi:hypothetical protein